MGLKYSYEGDEKGSDSWIKDLLIANVGEKNKELKIDFILSFYVS